MRELASLSGKSLRCEPGRFTVAHLFVTEKTRSDDLTSSHPSDDTLPCPALWSAVLVCIQTRIAPSAESGHERRENRCIAENCMNTFGGIRFCGTVQRQTDTASKAPVPCRSPRHRIEFRQGSLGRDDELKQRRVLRAHAATLLALHAAASRDQEPWEALSDGCQSRLHLRAGRDGSFVSKCPGQPTPYSRRLALFGRQRTTDGAFTKVCGVDAGHAERLVRVGGANSQPSSWMAREFCPPARLDPE